MRLRGRKSRGEAGAARASAMPASGAAALGALGAVMGLAAPARAQHVEYKASITLTGAYTQSITDSLYPNAQTFAGPTVALSPALVVLVDTLRTENTLNYALSLSVPFAIHANAGVNTAALTYANHLTYAGHYALSELTSMTLGAGFTESPLNTFIPSQDPTAAPIQATPAGSAVTIAVNATEGFSRQVSERNVFTQSGAFTYGHPIDPVSDRAQTYSATNSFALNHTFQRDTLGATITNQFNYFTASAGAGTDTAPTAITLPSHTAWVNTLALNWVHPFSEAFSSTIVAGATQTLSPEAAVFMQVQPTGSATLNYNFLLATAGLAYAHQAQPNVTTGTVNFTDSVTLRFSAPIKVTGLTTLGTVGYTHSVPIGTPVIACPGDMPNCSVSTLVTNPTHVFAADAGLEYHPERVPTLTVGMRGQLTRQIVADDLTLTNNFTRYTVSLNLTYSYPNANAAATRPQLSPLYSTQAPPASDVISTDRFFSAPVAGPAPAEPAARPKGP